MSSDGGDSDLGVRGRGFRGHKGAKEEVGLIGSGERIGGGNYEGPVDESFSKFIRNLVQERNALDAEQFPNIHRLIQAELDKAAKGSYGSMSQEPVFIDLYNDPPITLTAKAMPPSRLFPKFNYAGRIIGPKGAYLKALMKETSAKMVLLGKGVMKDKEKEEELRRSNDPKFLHLNEDMHVSIQVTASASEAYKRMAFAISCLKEQVMSDNRSLETLPWITGSSGRMDGGRYPPPAPKSSYPAPPPEYSAGPAPRSHHRSAAPPASGYDYGDPGSPGVPVYRRYPQEMSPPPPRRSDPMKSSYGDASGQWRSVDQVPRGGSDYVRRARSPPGSSRMYPSPPPYDDSYAAYYGSPDSYYPPPVDNMSYGPMPGRGGSAKASTSRYAPYKK